MASEADLDADIKGLSILSEHSELYDEFAKLGCAGSLVSLLSHENTDIAIDAIEVINELTDEDVEADESQWLALVEAMVCSTPAISLLMRYLTILRWKPICLIYYRRILRDLTNLPSQIELEFITS